MPDKLIFALFYYLVFNVENRSTKDSKKLFNEPEIFSQGDPGYYLRVSVTVRVGWFLKWFLHGTRDKSLKSLKTRS